MAAQAFSKLATVHIPGIRVIWS